MAYWHGSDFKMEDTELGQMMMEASASSGVPMAVAHCHYWGWNGLEQDIEKSFEMFLKIEKETNGDHWAQHMLGVCYRNGFGTDQDHDKTFKFFTKSAEQGNSLAMNSLGFCYDNGVGCDQNEDKAFEWCKKSAKLGNSSAMCNVGCWDEDTERSGAPKGVPL